MYEKNNVGVKVVPDARRIKGKKRFLLKLRITYMGRRSYYGVGHDASEENGRSLTALKRREHYENKE